MAPKVSVPLSSALHITDGSTEAQSGSPKCFIQEVVLGLQPSEREKEAWRVLGKKSKTFKIWVLVTERVWGSDL